MKSYRYTICAMAVVAIALCMLFSAAMAKQQMFQGKPVIEGTWMGLPAQYVGGEILVMFQDADVPADDIARTVGGRIARAVEADGFTKIEVPVDSDIPALCERLYSDSRVRFAEPNFMTRISEWNPNDTYYVNGTQHSLRNTGQSPPAGIPDADIDANWAWDYTRGSGSVVISIFDSGIDMDTVTLVLRHADLNAPGKIIIGPDYIGDGHSVADQNGHGTHVSGIAAAEVNNSTGIAGVAGDCDIMMTQVFNRFGNGTYEALRDAINNSVSYQGSHPSVRVIMSFSGGGGSGSSIVYTALQSAQTAGVLFVTASGNDYSSICNYPCQYSSDFNNVICVGATNPWDDWSPYSNYCADINVTAPGGSPFANPDPEHIWSTLPPNTYGYKDGTSMATPMVSGICGLVVTQNMSITAASLKTLIQNTADDEVGTLANDPEGYDNKFGYGRVNAWSAVIHSPVYITPYLRQDQRCSNVYTAAGQNRYYRLAPPSEGTWEVAAVRPNTGIDADVAWISTDGSTVLSNSAYGGQIVDFVLANQRPTSGSDYYAKVSDYSGSGKFTVEYQRATESYIGSMYKADFQWKSAHVVEIWELYLESGKRYTFMTDVTSGEVDVGMSLVGRSGAGAYYTQRSSAVFNVDATGSGGDEGISQDISADGWYALVVWSNNGRNGVMDVYCEERSYPGTPVTRAEHDGVQVHDGHFYTYYSSGASVGVIGVRSNPGNDYDMRLFNVDEYDYQGNTGLASSYYGTGSVDYVLFDKAGISSGWFYPKVEEWYSSAGTSGYTTDAEVTDETLSLGSNGPFTFTTSSVVRAWDVTLTNGVEYQFTADITSGSVDIGIGLHRQDATYKPRSSYIRYAYSGGPGSDQSFSWICDATGDYTVVVWSDNGAAATYYVNITTYPNIVPFLLGGWDYEVVPRNTGGATIPSCPITATLPGNTSDTYFNLCGLDDSPNAIPAITFWNQISIDDVLHEQRSWGSGLPGNYAFVTMNFQSSNSIKGGKHTITLDLDGTNTIAESNETDNDVSYQFVWSPLVLARDVPVERTAPPGSNLLFPRPNCDGFQFTKTPGYAFGVAICPRNSADDYDLEICDDYSGSLSGFDSVRAGSYFGGWSTDFAVGSYLGVASPVYPDVRRYLGGTGNFVIDAQDSYGRLLTPTDETRRDTLGTDHILRVYESYLAPSTTYVITLDNISGGANLDLTLFGPDYGYYGSYDYAAASWGGSIDEQIVYTTPPGGTYWYVITVHKTAYGALPLTSIFDLSVQIARPNLVTTTPTGWSYEFVPRNVGGATAPNCLITSTLPGNTTNTYLNFSGLNDGLIAVPATTFYDQLSLDGSFFFERPWATGLSSGSTLYHINWTTTTPIRGGRHTIELRLDGYDDIFEMNEMDNSVARQFVWSPLVISPGATVFRGVPPPVDFTFPQPNCDGFLFTRTPQYAYAVGICPLASNDDYDLVLYNDYVGSESGFSNLVGYSDYVAGITDFVVATYSGTDATVYPGAYTWSAASSNEYVIEGNDAAGKIFNPLTDNVIRDTLATSEILNVYEVLLQSGNEYRIAVDNVSGTANMALAVYGPTYGYYNRSAAVAYSDVAGPDEEIIYTPSATSYHVIVVFKPVSGDLVSQNIYDISVQLTAVNLTYSTPTGWSYPIVPRNTGGATPSNCTVTASLPGNTNTTNYNVSSYNEGPGPVLKSYYDYVFIDSVSTYGAFVSPPIGIGAFSLRQNLVSSNVVRGGRHTMAVFIDRRDSIPETDENDNWYQRQFVWTPYILSNYAPITRDAPPRYGTEVYPNSDGFEYTTGYWGAVGTLPFNATDDFNLRLHQPWTDAETGFDLTEAGSGYGSGLSDFVIANEIYSGGRTMDVGVVQDFGHLGTGQLVVQQANEQTTFYSYGTYGPYTIGSGEVMGMWEVYPLAAGSHNFQVDVISGSADIGTSLYYGDDTYFSKSGYMPGGFSNSAGAGGDESMTASFPAPQYTGWAVWKVGSADRTQSSTFYLTWGPSTVPVPASVDDLVIIRLDSTNVRLRWTAVTEDTSGNPLTINYYRIHRSTDPHFVPSPADSIGMTTGMSYDDSDVMWPNEKYFYSVIAVDTDGVVASAPNPPTPRIIATSPTRDDSPRAIREQHQK